MKVAAYHALDRETYVKTSYQTWSSPASRTASVKITPMPSSWCNSRWLDHNGVRIVTERSNAATEERLKSGHAVGGVSIVW